MVVLDYTRNAQGDVRKGAQHPHAQIVGLAFWILRLASTELRTNSIDVPIETVRFMFTSYFQSGGMYKFCIAEKVDRMKIRTAFFFYGELFSLA